MVSILFTFKSQRQKQEMEKRISRPFTSLKVLLWDKVQPSNKEVNKIIFITYIHVISGFNDYFLI